MLRLIFRFLVFCHWLFDAIFNVSTGVMAGIFALGTLAAVVAVKGQQRRLAHYIMSFVYGVIWYLGLAIPISPLGELLWESFPNLVIMLVFCLLSLLLGGVLQFTGLHEPDGIPRSTILVVAAFFIVPASLASLPAVGELRAAMMVGLVLLEVPLVSLLAWAMANLLRLVGDASHDAIAAELEVFAAVERLETANRNTGRLSIFPEDILRYVGQEPQTIARHLDRLIEKGHLGYTPREGYFLMKRHA